MLHSEPSHYCLMPFLLFENIDWRSVRVFVQKKLKPEEEIQLLIIKLPDFDHLVIHNSVNLNKTLIFLMTKRSDIIVILVFIVIVLLKPDFIVEFISKKEVMMVVNILIGGFLVFNIVSLVRKRNETEKFWLKIFFSAGILIVPILFLVGQLELDTQALLLYMIIIGFFYMTMM